MGCPCSLNGGDMELIQNFVVDFPRNLTICEKELDNIKIYVEEFIRWEDEACSEVGIRRKDSVQVNRTGSQSII
jgi:hypothetical protein